MARRAGRYLLAAAVLATACSKAVRRRAEAPPTAPRDAPAPTVTSASAPSSRLTRSLIQIGITTRGERIDLRAEGPVDVTDQSSGRSRDLISGRLYVINAADHGHFHLGPIALAGPARISPNRSDATVTIGQTRYRGSIFLRPNGDGTLAVVNELGLEEYLYGVVPAEMSSDWPFEALKAQAVVARTFALHNLGKFHSSGFDLTDDSRSQAYGGFDKETARIRQAVDATRGQVLIWRGQMVQAFFHSCCGGHTDDYGAVWGGGPAPRPLRGVTDKYCRPSPQFQWSAYFTDDDILSALQRHGHAVARLKNVRIREKDLAGFVHTFRVSADDVSFDVASKDLRAWLGNKDLRSTKILRITRRKRGYSFLGRGFGHGVGMCQWGAHYMAKKDKDFRKILLHYFPESEMSQYDD